MDNINGISPELINAIAGLWPLGLVIALFFTILIFRKPLYEWLSRLLIINFRRGDTELRLERDKESSKETKDKNSGGDIAELSEESTIKPKQLPGPQEHKGDAEFLSDMFDAFFARDFDAAEKAYSGLLSSTTDPIERQRNEVIYNYLRYTETGNKSAIQELKRLSDIKEIRTYALRLLAECYKHSGSYENAQNMYELAVESSDNDKDKAENLSSLAKLLYEMGNTDKAFKVLETNLLTLPPSDCHAILYRSLANLYKHVENNLMRAIVLEKALEFEPNNLDLIFEAAYAQSEVSLSSICLTNYDILLRQKPDHATALNNSGVEAERMKLPIHSVKFYNTSEEKGETLAMSNLAHLYLNQGFVREAEAILGKAQQCENVHPNVSDAISKVSRQIKDEESRWDKILQNGIKQKSFLHKYTEARYATKINEDVFSGSWKLIDEKLQIIVDGENFMAEWGSGNKKRKLEGTIVNNSAQVKLFNWSTSWWSGKDNGYYSSLKSGFAYFDAEANELLVLVTEGEEIEFLKFNRFHDTVPNSQAN